MQKHIFLFASAITILASFKPLNGQPFTQTPVNTSVQSKKAVSYLPDSARLYRWNTNTGTFETSGYQLYTYDTQGNLARKTDKTADGKWQARISNLYENNKLTQTTEERYDTVKQGFINYKKELIVYDARGNKTSHHKFNYDTLTREFVINNIDSFEINYDAGNRTDTLTERYYDVTSQAWIPVIRYLHAYNAASVAPENVIGESWDNTTWVKTFKVGELVWGMGYENIYESLSTSYNSYSWDDSNWIPQGHDRISYSNAHADTSTSYSWDGTTITPLTRVLYAYDGQGTLFSRAFESYSNNLWKPDYGVKDSLGYGSLGQVVDGVHMVYYPNISSGWIRETRFENFYAPGLLTKNIADPFIRVYPNPSSGTFYIETPAGGIKLQVYDIQGHEIMSAVSPENPLTVFTSGWEKGVYFLRMESVKGVSFQHIIVR